MSTLTINDQDAQQGFAIAALVAEGNPEAALELCQDPVTLAAVYGMAQALEGYFAAVSSTGVEWPVIAQAHREQIRLIEERRGRFLSEERAHGGLVAEDLSPSYDNLEESE